MSPTSRKVKPEDWLFPDQRTGTHVFFYQLSTFTIFLSGLIEALVPTPPCSHPSNLLSEQFSSNKHQPPFCSVMGVYLERPASSGES